MPGTVLGAKERCRRSPCPFGVLRIEKKAKKQTDEYIIHNKGLRNKARKEREGKGTPELSL